MSTGLEMQAMTGINNAPVFCPIVADFYSGMEVTVPIFKNDLKISLSELKDFYKDYYKSGLISYNDAENEEGFLSAAGLSGKDNMEITVCGNEDRILLVSRFDNLGKGASGAAIQNMNIILGIDERTGLEF